MAKIKKSERFDAIYARQSVDKRDSVSIEAQIDDCKVKCSEKIRVYKDKGYSGKNIERPDLQRLMDDIEAGIIKKLLYITGMVLFFISCKYYDEQYLYSRFMRGILLRCR